MRKSLPKTRPSQPSSRVASLPPGLLAAAPGRRRAAKANGDASAERVTIVGRDERLSARLRLLEAFLSRTEVADCAQHALQWLGSVLGVPQSLCLVRHVGEPQLAVIASYGLPAA